ncbi:hypothetical protein Zmor_004925 [Zophobas morio]|uniref:Uncharacterized protein n=2 Tax=Zophobas morio TaxID=2755281 RepID=A0AA38IV25_9CUCU|nr:hypothetical protein Zmor_004925 [Zophobas morio]
MSQNKDVSPGLPVLPCKKCKIMPVAGLTCIKCGSLSHPSCVKLLKNVKTISETRINCCDNSDNFDNSVLQSQPDELLIPQSQFEILITKAIEPLLMQIESLRNDVRNLKESNVELVRLLTCPSMVNSQQMQQLKSYYVTNSEKSINFSESEVSAPKNPVFSHTKNEYRVGKKYVNTRDKKATADNPTQDIMSSSSRDKPKDKIVCKDVQDDDWVVQRRSHKSGRRKAPTIVGTLKNVNECGELRSSYVKRAWFYVGKVVKGTEASVVKQYVRNKLSSNDMVVENISVNGIYEAFKLGVPFEYKDLVLKEDFWPQGVSIRRFNFPKNSFLGGKQPQISAKNLNLPIP